MSITEYKRRQADTSFIKTHHVLTSFIGIFIAATSYVFTTFATIHYVDSRTDSVREEITRQNEEIKGALRDLKQEIIENRAATMRLLERTK